MASRYLNNITINDAYTFPSTDGTAGQVMTTDGGGNITFETIADGESIKVACKNTSGSTITKGTPVYITGTVGSSYVIEIAVADASNISKMPAVGLLETDLANNGEGYVITGGILKNLTTDPIDSSTPSSNDTIYVKPGGGLTLTKPSGTNYIQNIGKVGRVNSSNAGSIVVSSIMRTNDVPAPLFVDVANQKVGIGDSTPSVSLDINATDAVQMPSGTTAQRPTGVNGMFRYNSDDNQFEGYADNAWGAIAGSGGGGTVTVEKNVYTGDNSTVAFNTTTAIISENNVQVYIDGVYQSKDNYTTSGNTVTFSTAPPSTTSVELIHMVAVSGIIARDSFTGNGSTVAYILSMSITNENATQVYIDGVYQSKDNYTTSGSTLTFSTSPPNGAAIEVVHIKAVDVSSLNQNSFTGDGSTTDFTLSQSIDDENKTFVFIQGVYQEKTTYSISGTTLTFSTAPQNGYTIEVMAFSSVTITNEHKYNVSVISSNTTAVANTLYVLTANLTLTLPASPSAGDSIKVSNRSGVATATIARNSENIMGAASDLTLDKLNSGFELIYSGSAQGWILIGVEGTSA